MREVLHQLDGTSEVWVDGDLQGVVAAGLTLADWDAQVVALLGPDLTLPPEIPMDRFQAFVDSTGRTSQVLNWINSLPGDMKRLALIAWNKSQNFVPSDAFGQLAKAALCGSFDNPDAAYAEFCRDAADFSIASYGDPNPAIRTRIVAAVTKFFGG